MKNTWLAMGVFLALPIIALAEQQETDPGVTMDQLLEARTMCDQMNATGEVRTEIFGIQIIRYGGTCVVVNGELDEDARSFLEEKNLPWAGVGLWIKATNSTD
ncbi:hypothetical protein RXV86_13010 [Alisedimentitalea sp. MJ-SS2]|uniref:hypothetical protein n=1 Tax=Aliisedimentitalea sp. MJ-SS2 TaxID=3049795 RepID=UPI00290A946F|nr:hypothetical protein [Alisedimentitalea sp. MJ-SS2]MDU8928309.1 hypothetical protein [Alisedimentitalea sp. MJ-SS2]